VIYLPLCDYISSVLVYPTDCLTYQRERLVILTELESGSLSIVHENRAGLINASSWEDRTRTAD